MEGGSCPKMKLAPSFLREQSQPPWKEDPVQPFRLEEFNSFGGSASVAQGKASSASFKKPLLDGWDQPSDNTSDQPVEKVEEKDQALAQEEDSEVGCPLRSQGDGRLSSPNLSCLSASQGPLVKSLHFEKGVFHQQRCAAITSDMCEMLLGGEHTYQGCMSSVAAFILEREVANSQSSCKETYELIALGTGDVCYEGWMEIDGRKLHDLHGMVLARRALMRYFYKQLLMFCSWDPAALEKCIFCWSGDGKHLELKPKYFLHLYLSRTPSGAAENFQTTASLHVSVKGLLRPVLYCRPSVLSAYVYCVSGSDKLARWTVLGVQGALLSHFLHPVYITSLVLADPYQDLAVLHQVVNERLQLGPQDNLPKPYGQRKIYLFEGPCMAAPDTPPKCRSVSLNWCGGDEMLEVVNGAVGKAERDLASPGGHFQPSRLCKAAMLRSFRKVAQEMKREDLISLPTYHDAKIQATAYQGAKRQMYSQLSLQDLGKWPQKKMVDSFCR